MIITILLIIACAVLGKSIGKLKEVNWGEVASIIWGYIKSFGLKAGRSACTPLLYFYYVMSDEGTSFTDKAIIYGAILYIISPFDLLPRRIIGLLGILDDAVVTAFVLKKIKDKITPEIEASVSATLDEWFGTYSPSTF